mgnify:FL=1
MSLLDLLKKGSILTDANGGEPTKMDLSSQEGKILKDSQLDLNTTNPKNMDLSSKYETDLLLSQLDLSENPPKKYLDNPPR